MSLNALRPVARPTYAGPEHRPADVTGADQAQRVRSWWRLISPPALGCILLLTSVSSSSSQGLLRTLFGPPKTTRSINAPLPVFLRPLAGLFQGAPRRGRLATTKAQRASARRESKVRVASIVAVPQVIPETVSDPVSFDGDIESALMNDPTLRKGDIVVFPDGPRVFNGEGRVSSRQPSDFDDLSTSRLVDEQTRLQVMAATATAGMTGPKLSFRARPKGRRSRP